MNKELDFKKINGLGKPEVIHNLKGLQYKLKYREPWKDIENDIFARLLENVIEILEGIKNL